MLFGVASCHLDDRRLWRQRGSRETRFRFELNVIRGRSRLATQSPTRFSPTSFG
jgi:hypothetical protein